MPSVRALVKNVVFDRLPGCLRRGPTSSRRVALTFDDGPDDYTERYLDVLDDLGVPATFFLCGAHADARPALVREYVRRGHQLANHGYDHARFTKLSGRELADQLTKTEQALGGQLTGRPWVRPPHGELDTSSVVRLLASGYTIALWSVDSQDYDDHDPASLAERCSPNHVGPGDVLLMHEGQQWTLDAIPRIVTALHAAGYECVTMHDLFAS
jgi:peptidoglycan-N-acetylglucosamine deacetylase